MRNTALILAVVAILGISCSAVTTTPQTTLYAYDNIIFEIAPTPGTSPSDETLKEFAGLLDYYGFCNRRHIGFVMQQEESNHEPEFWQLSYIHAMELRRRTLIDSNVNDRTAVVFVPYIFGSFLDGAVNKRIAGLQYGPSSFAMFRSSLKNSEPQLLLHEFCHMFGLLKNRTEEPKLHCPDETCIMHPVVMGPTSMLCENCETILRSRIAQRW